MPIKKVRRVSVGDQVFEQIKDMLLKNEFKQGEKLPSENELAVLFGVSRVSIRHALQKLTALGLIETRLGEGSFVKEINCGIYADKLIPLAYLGENSLKEVMVFRKVIEGRVAELATQMATEEEIQEIEKAYEKMVSAENNLSDFSAADFEFHVKLAEATHNALIIEIYHIIHEVLSETLMKVVSIRGVKTGLQYHKQLLDLMKKREHEKVRQIMDSNMEETYEDCCEQILKKQ